MSPSPTPVLLPPVCGWLDEWMGVSPLPALVGAEGAAERLVVLVHRGVDWDVWGGTRRARYWDAFAERVRAATYTGPSLSHWWQSITVALTSAPRSPEDREAVAALVQVPGQREVLTVLHEHAATLVLRARVLAEARRAAYQATHTGPAAPATSGEALS